MVIRRNPMAVETTCLVEEVSVTTGTLFPPRIGMDQGIHGATARRLVRLE